MGLFRKPRSKLILVVGESNMAASFNVQFSGRLKPGYDPEQVKTNVAKIFRKPVSQIEALFSGKTIIIKKSIDYKTAIKYKATLEKAGAIAQIQPADQTDVATTDQSNRNRQTHSDTSNAIALSNSSEKIASKNKPDNPSIKEQSPSTMALLPWDIDEPLTPQRLESAPIVDLSGYSMAELGDGDLSERAEIPTLAIDLSHLDMAEVGEILGTPREVTTTDVDIDHLSVLAPGEISMSESEQAAIQPKIPDTSKIELCPLGTEITQTSESSQQIKDDSISELLD